MKSKELLKDVMKELEVTEELDISGGSAYSVARGLACIWGAMMAGSGHSCSLDGLALNPGKGPAGGFICTHR